MATFISNTITVGTYTRARIVVEETSKNAVGNKTDGKCYVQMWRTNTGYTTYGTGTLYIGIDGLGWVSSEITASQKITYNSYTVIGSVRTFTIPHDSDGSWKANFYAYTSTNNDNITFSKATFNVTLTPIDRAAPTVTHSVSSLSSSGFKISISSSATCDTFQYSTDGGSTYTTCSTTAGTSASVTLSGLSSKTYSIRTRARKSNNHIYGYSTKATVDIIPPTVTHSVSNITANGFKISISASHTCNQFAYSIDGGSTYTNFSTTEGTSASVTVTGLSANKSYSIMVRAKRSLNGIYGYSTKDSAKTLGQTVITETSKLFADESPMALTFKGIVYDKSFYHKIELVSGKTTIDMGHFEASTASAQTFTFEYNSSNTRRNVLTAISDCKEKNMTLVVKTYSDSSCSTQIGDSSECNIKVTTSFNLSAPTFSSFTFKDNNDGVVKITENNQILVQSMSDLLVSCSAGTAKNYAEILSYTAMIGDVTVSSPTTTIPVGAVETAGELTLTVTCTDSRGYSTSRKTKVKVVEYELPSVKTFVAKRKNDVEAIVGISYEGSFSPIVIDGVAKNEITNVRYKYKLASDEWDNPAVSVKSSLVIMSSSYYGEITDLGTEFDIDESYSFYLYINDKLCDVATDASYAKRSKMFPLPPSKPSISLRKKDTTHNFRRVGINNNGPHYPLDVGADDDAKSIAVNGKPIVDFPLEQGTSGSWLYRKWNSGLVECWYQVLQDVSITNEYEGWYYLDVEVTFPSNLFIEAPKMFPSVGGRGVMTAMHFSSNSKKTTVRICSASSGTFTNQAVGLYAVGRWK